MKYASVCSGVEAASLAWMPLGWQAAWFSEIEPFPCAVLKERFPDVPNLGDMTKIKVENLDNGDQRFTGGDGTTCLIPGGVDLLVGGTPCQGFSVAGKQGGLRDERSVLCLAYCELLAAMRPRWFVWENVPGVFSTGDGEDFRAFLRKIDEIGCCCAYRILDAQYVRVDGYPRAVPQRRRRVFVVGHSSADWRYPASVLFEPDSLFGNTPPRRVKGQGFTADIGNGAPKTGRCFRGSRPGEFVSDEVSGTIKRNIQSSGNSSATLVAVETGRGFYRESQVGQTLKACGDRHPRNFVCIGFRGGRSTKSGSFAVSAESSPTIGSAESGTNRTPNVLAFTANDNERDVYQDLSPTIRKGGERVSDGGAIIPAVLCYENHGQDSRVKGLKDGVSPQINAKSGTGGNNLPLVLSGAIVRRLLPVECERLMGFPDNWTRIPWKGKPEEDCPDSPRYKACGNSMCVNVMRWIGMRIELVERKMAK